MPIIDARPLTRDYKTTITHDDSFPINRYTVWLGQPHCAFTPHVTLDLRGLIGDRLINTKEIDINGWKVGPALARQYAHAILEACDLAEAGGLNG